MSRRVLIPLDGTELAEAAHRPRRPMRWHSDSATRIIPERRDHARRRPGQPPARRARPEERPSTGPFPGARLARLGEAPARCPNCGGPWRRLRLSVACLLCPTELYAAAELERTEAGR